MSKALPQFRWKFTPLIALLGALILAFLLFSLIPLTQLFDIEKKEILEIREVVTLPPPPPTIPPIVEENTLIVEPLPSPTLEQAIEEIPITQLELSLNVGIGDAMAMGVPSIGFSTGTDLVDEIKQLFTFDDLTEKPRIISAPSVQFPRSLSRRREKQGTVTMLIEIDTRGKVRLIEIIDSTHPELEPVARRTIAKTRMTIPKRNGQPVTVRGTIPMTFKDSN